MIRAVFGIVWFLANGALPWVLGFIFLAGVIYMGLKS